MEKENKLRSPPCFLCGHSEHYSRLIDVVTVCKIKNEKICDRNWIVVESCWKYCLCASCKYRSEEKKAGSNEK